MKANPGGMLVPEEIVGRDKLIRAIWRSLEVQSVILTSERRIGKTSVARKMLEENSGSDRILIFRDVENLETPEEFVQAVYEDLMPVLSKSRRVATGFQQLLSTLGGAEIWDVKLPHIGVHWKALLAKLIEDVCADGRQIIFFWDELPLFLHKVTQKLGEAAAIEILDTFRALRQRHPSLRMVYTGSLGLHHVVRALRKKRYANSPTNDMRVIEVPPLTPADGVYLAMLLIEGEGLKCADDPGAVAEEISNCVGHVPFYIHTLVASLADSEVSLTRKLVQEKITALIVDANDPADFRNYRTRLFSYYDGEERDVVFSLLDQVAFSSHPLSYSELAAGVAQRHGGVGDDLIREVVDSLERDHYLYRESESGAYVFRYELVRLWWRSERA